MRVDEDGMKEEKEGDRFPRHLMSPPTFQPWFLLWHGSSTALWRTGQCGGGGGAGGSARQLPDAGRQLLLALPRPLQVVVLSLTVRLTQRQLGRQRRQRLRLTRERRLTDTQPQSKCHLYIYVSRNGNTTEPVLYCAPYWVAR